MFKINAKGWACPLPVVKAKKALENNNDVQVIVDNEIATQNLKKLAEQLQIEYSCIKNHNSEYVVELKKNGIIKNNKVLEERTITNIESYIVVIDKETMGQGSEELGKTLMKAFIFSLLEQDILPQSIIFYNGGIKLVIDESEVIEDLKEIKNRGVNIFACGACVDYYGMVDRISVSEITNMYRIVEMMTSAEKIIKP